MIHVVPNLIDSKTIEIVNKQFHTVYSPRCNSLYSRNLFDCAEDALLRPICDHIASKLVCYLPEKYHMSCGKGAITLIDAPSFQENQSWHKDGEHLNISVFIPCVHITNNGATQIIPNTEELRPKQWRKNYKNMIEYKLNAGDALLFSGRLLHRGLSNHTKNRRPVIALTFVPDGGVEYNQELNMF